MKHSNSALNFQLAQYRAIFSDPLVVKGLASALVISAGTAACYAQTADASALDSKDKWDNGLKSGSNIIAITGNTADSGQGGKYTNITINANQGMTRYDLKSNQGLLIADADHPYTNNYFKADGKGNTLYVLGGVVTVGGNATGTASNSGLQVGASNGATAYQKQYNLNVNSELHISTSGAGSNATVTAYNITIGNKASDAAAKVVVGDNSNGYDGAGFSTLGAADSKLTVNRNGAIEIVANASSDVAAANTVIDGGQLHFKKGTAQGRTSFNSANTELNNGYVRVDKDSNAKMSRGSFNVNGSSNVEIQGKLDTYQQNINVGDAATLAASSGSTGGSAQIKLSDQSNLKLNKAKLKEFLTGIKEDGTHVQYVDIAESAADKRVKEAGQGSIHLIKEGSIVLTDAADVDIADTDYFKFSSNSAENASIYADLGSEIASKNVTVSKSIDNAKNLTVKAANLSLGSEGFDSRSKSLGVRRFFAQNVQFNPEKGQNNYTLQDEINLVNDGNGVIKGNVTVSGGSLAVTGGGNYELEKGKDLILEKDGVTSDTAKKPLSALIVKDASLKVSGKLHASATGSAYIENGQLDASQASSLKIGDNSIKLGENSAVVINGQQVLELKNPDSVSFHGDAFSEKAFVSSDDSAVSTVTLTNLGSMNVDQYRDLKQKTGYNGFFNGFDITGVESKPEMKYGEIESNTPDSIYRNTEVSVTGPVDKPISVGRVEVSTGSLAIQEHTLSSGKKTGNLVKLTNSSANGNTSHNFVQSSDGKLAGVELDGAGAALQLQGTGNIGSIDAKADKNGKLYIGSADSTASAHVTVQGNIGSQTNSLKHLTVQSNSDVSVTGDTVRVSNLLIQPGSSLVAKKATVTLAPDYSGSVTPVSKFSIKGDLDAKELQLASPAKPQSGTVIPITTFIEGGGTTNLEQFSGGENTILQIGNDGEGGQNGTLIAKNVALNKGTLFVDPDFDVEASYAVVNNLSGSKAHNDAGTLDGKAIVGKNAVLGIGFDNKSDVVSIIKNKLNSHGAFVEGSDVQNALVLNKKVTLAGSDSISIDANYNPNQATGTGNAVTFGTGSALVVTDKVFESTGPGSPKTGAAIQLTGTNKNIKTDDGGVVILSGKFTEQDKNIQIFSGSNVTISKAIQVQSANGLLTGTIDNSSKGQVKDLALDRERLRSMFKNTSKPVADMLEKALAGQDPKFYEDPTKAGAQFVAQVATDSQTAVELDRAVHAASYAGAQQAAIDTSNAMTNAMMDRGEALNANREGRKLKDIYTQAYYKATAERKGNKVEVTTPTLASNTNTGVWATPTYVNTKADGYEAENASYGADIDIKGVTVGADTLVGNATIGVAASIGTGKADGNGQGKGLKDDFDYYGLGAYTAMSFGQFSLIGDTSVTAMKHDISGASGIQGFGNLSSSVDSLAISAGVTGKYKFETPYMDVTPHFGTRFLRLSTDSYDLYSDGKRSNLMNTDYDAQNIFSFPVGVSLSKQYHVGGWILNPDVDLTLTVNAGDTDAKSSSKIYGVKDPLDLTTQVMDDVTYRAKVGFGVTNGNFNTNINFHYTGSENTESYGINANVGYDF